MKKKTNRTRDMILAILFTLAVMLCPCFLFNVCVDGWNHSPKRFPWLHKILFENNPDRNKKK